MVARASALGMVSDESKRTSAIRQDGFTKSVWGIDWSECLQNVTLGDGIVVECRTFEGILPFVSANFDLIFEENPTHARFLVQKLTPAKMRYYKDYGDVFAFIDGPRTAGVLVCTPVDWSTYYVRFVAILPEYRGSRLFQGLLPKILERLTEAGIERVEAETSPSNLAFVHIMNKFGFNITGTTLTERWGALVRFTKFLDPQSEDVFLRQYCTGVKYQLRGRNQIDPPERRPL